MAEATQGSFRKLPMAWGVEPPDVDPGDPCECCARDAIERLKTVRTECFCGGLMVGIILALAILMFMG